MVFDGDGEETMTNNNDATASPCQQNKNNSEKKDASVASLLSSPPVLALKRSKRLTSKSKAKLQKKTQTQPKKDQKSKMMKDIQSASSSSAISVAKNPLQTANGKVKNIKDTRKKSKIVTVAIKNSRVKKSSENDTKPTAKAIKKSSRKESVGTTRLQRDKAKQKQKIEHQDSQGNNLDDTDCSNPTSDSEEEEAACCLCHCGLDCSDRALFFPKDRKSEVEKDEDYDFNLNDPYLDGDKFYDRNNALVYCDTCNRLYHQKCHFVPLLVIPRGDFHCLICSIQQQQTSQNKQQFSKKRKRNGNVTETETSQSSAIKEKALDRKITDQIFQCAPRSTGTNDVQYLQKEWELRSASFKARLWERQLKQFKTFLRSQASNIRMANTTLATMTSTKRNRQHFLIPSSESSKSGSRSSQELAQTLCKLTGAQLKIREALLSLEAIRTSNEAIDYSSLFSWGQEYSQHANHVFPFGFNLCRDERRIMPRTKERKPSIIEGGKQGIKNCGLSRKCNNKDNIIPNEIIVNNINTNTVKHSTQLKESKSSNATAKCSKVPTRSKRGEKNGLRSTTKPAHVDVKTENNDDDDDDDSGITLDDLKCSVCLFGDCTDENDVILCDGKDCHRAFHMKCVFPIVKSEDIENEHDDWFCPICASIAHFMGEMHDLCIGDDDDDDDTSSGSWADVHDIFPNSKWQNQTAVKILKGKRNDDTQRLVAMFFGEDVNKNQVQMPVGSDSEDENDYSLFDEDSFEERRHREREEEDDGDSNKDDSTCSSQATLQGKSSIEYKVGKNELAALSEDEDECSVEKSDEESETNIRRSRRLIKRKDTVEESNGADVGADFSEANIVNGKRKRRRVNYRKLNDMMFGDLSDHQQVMIDGGDDFDASKIKVTKTESDNDSDDHDAGNGNIAL